MGIFFVEDVEGGEETHVGNFFLTEQHSSAALHIDQPKLVEAEARHAPLNDNAPATPKAVTAFLGLFVLEIV